MFSSWWGWGPISLIDVHQADYRIYQALGIKAIKTEAADHWAAAGQSYYVMAKLWWNPDADVQAIKEDFVRMGFGRAYEPMWRYYERINDNRAYLTSEVLTAMRHDLEEAASLARRPDVIQRINVLRLYHVMLATLNDAQRGAADLSQLAVAARIGKTLVGQNMVGNYMARQIGRLYDQAAAPNSVPADQALEPYSPEALARVLANLRIPESDASLALWADHDDLRLKPIAEPAQTFEPRFNMSFRYGPATILIHAQAGESIVVRAFRDQASVQYELFGPDMAMLDSGRFGVDKPLISSATQTGIYTLNVIPGARWTPLAVDNQFAAIKAASPTQVLHPIGRARLYFHVPVGTTSFGIAMRSAGEPYTLTVWGPGDADTPLLKTPMSKNANFHTYRIDVPKGADGQVWRLALGGEDKQIFLLGIPPLLTSDPARVLRLAP